MRPEIVLGPPGTGKTTTLLGIVDEELGRGTSPGSIGYVSFTRRAAEEAVTRACKKFSMQRDDFPYFRTLHSLCFYVLGLTRGQVLTDAKLQDWSKVASLPVTGRFSEDGMLSGYELGDRVLHFDNMARVQRRPLREVYDTAWNPRTNWSTLHYGVESLRKFCEAHGYVDFTGMLEGFVSSGVSVGLDVLLVDEAQDLSALQWEVVRQLACGCRRVVVAGDDDQAIYAWAGADVEHLIGMEGDVRVLGQSWRVPRRVQALAEEVIGKVHRRRPKEWAPRDAEGEVIRGGLFEDVDVPEDDVLVLARCGFLLDEVERELRERGVIYERHGHPSVRASVLTAILAWEQLRRGEVVTADRARKVYEQMSSRRGVAHGFKKLPALEDDDRVTLAQLREHHGLLVDAPWFEALDRVPSATVSYVRNALEKGEKLTAEPRVRLQTIHTAKGGEADHVVLLTEVTRAVQRGIERDPDDERRTWYVGLTRARQKLTMVTPGGYSRGTRAERAPRCPWV